MGVAAMDSTMDIFLKTLMMERSFSCPDQLNNLSDSSCILVDDNARCHTERWSRLSRKVRSQMYPRSERKKIRSRSVNVNRSLSNNSTEGASSRWMSMESSQNGSPRSVGGPTGVGSLQLDGGIAEAAIPAPPCCPQRQKSIEVNQQQLAQHIRDNTSQDICSNLPRAPQRQQSVEVSSSNAAAILYKNNNRNNDAVAPAEEQLRQPLRMPQRQTSDQPDSSDEVMPPLPPPPPNTSLKKHQPHPIDGEGGVQLAGQSFTKVIKRTRASLLDDDEDDDDDDMEVDHPVLMMPTSS